MEIGDMIFKLMGKPDPRDALAQLAAQGQQPGGAGATQQPVGTPAATAAPGQGQQPAAPPQPEAYQSPPQLFDLYQQLMDRQAKNAAINRGIGLIGAGLAHEENRAGILQAFTGGGASAGQQNPATMIEQLMKFQTDQASLAQKAAQRATIPDIAKQYGLDVKTATYLYDTGKLDSIIAEAEKPNKQITEQADGTHVIVDLSDGSISDPFGVAKKREVELVEDPITGGKIAMYKDTKERVGAGSLDLPGNRKTEFVEDPITGSKIRVYSDTKEPVGTGNLPGNRKTEFIADPITGGQIRVYSDTKEPVGTGNLPGSGNTEQEQLYNAAMRDLPPEKRVPLQKWLDDRAASSRTQINVGPQGIDYGPPPKDMAWKRDPVTKEVMVTPEGAPIAIRIAGTAAAVEAEAAGKVEEVKKEQKLQAATIVTEDIDRAMAKIDENKDSWFPSTGLTGKVGSQLPGVAGIGGDSYDVNELLTTVKANLGFEQLSAMRAASPTGAALGPVSDFENQLLQSVTGSLDIGQGYDQLMYNLRRIKKMKAAVVNGDLMNRDGTPNAAAIIEIMKDDAPPAAAGEEEPIDDILKRYN